MPPVLHDISFDEDGERRTFANSRLRPQFAKTDGGRLSLGASQWSLAMLLAGLPALALETDCLVRDPSTIVKRGGTYWIYGTGPGAQQFSSTDRLHWTSRGPALPTAPDWLARTVPGNKNDVWAPDVHFFNGKYYLYSSYSQWGSNVSGIGVATSATLDPKSWVGQGLVTRSANAGDGNAIDPCVFEDAGGGPWLSYGSYATGIKLIPLDPATGRQAAGSAVTRLATRPGVPGNAIEASYIYYRDGYYYLFVNWDSCCAGSKSQYNIRVGRSRTVTGPYLDKSGRDMMEGGGTLFLAAVPDNGTGRPPDDETGPGHVGILREGNDFWLSTHYEWARDRNGATTVNVQKLAWDGDGWPRAVLDPGPYTIVSFLATHGVVGVAARGSGLETQPFSARKGQGWILGYRGDGFYSLLNADGHRALSVTGDSAKPGARVEAAPFKGRPSQLWYLQQNDDGTYTLLTKSSGKAVALDVPNCSLTDGTPLGQWTALGNDCQKWSFRRR